MPRPQPQRVTCSTHGILPAGINPNFQKGSPGRQKSLGICPESQNQGAPSPPGAIAGPAAPRLPGLPRRCPFLSPVRENLVGFRKSLGLKLSRRSRPCKQQWERFLDSFPGDFPYWACFRTRDIPFKHSGLVFKIKCNWGKCSLFGENREWNMPCHVTVKFFHFILFFTALCWGTIDIQKSVRIW